MEHVGLRSRKNGEEQEEIRKKEERKTTLEVISLMLIAKHCCKYTLQTRSNVIWPVKVIPGSNNDNSCKTKSHFAL